MCVQEYWKDLRNRLQYKFILLAPVWPKPSHKIRRTENNTLQTHIMNLIDQIYRLQRINQLIRMKATGPPCQFSNRLGISERQLYRLLDELKSYGLPIEYSRACQSLKTHNVQTHF